MRRKTVVYEAALKRKHYFQFALGVNNIWIQNLDWVVINIKTFIIESVENGIGKCESRKDGTDFIVKLILVGTKLGMSWGPKQKW